MMSMLAKRKKECDLEELSVYLTKHKITDKSTYRCLNSHGKRNSSMIVTVGGLAEFLHKS